MNDKTNIKTTDWLTRGITKEQIAREKREAIMSADLEECMSFDICMKKEADEKTVDYDYVAEKMVAKGYCKKSEVIDEFVKMLKDTSMTKWDYHEAVDVEEIDRIAAKMKGGGEGMTDRELNEIIDWCRKKLANEKSNPCGLTGKRMEGYEQAMKVVMSYLHSRKGGKE